jgi:imidazole glycerol-phosphate synthase subunit HisH
MISIVDYGLGNLGSIHNMLRKLGVAVQVTSDPTTVADAEKLILPGVGSFDNGMENLERLGLVPVLHRAVLERRVPVLGICLGAQLMTRSSEEGRKQGLGWIAADTIRFFSRSPELRLPVPHMGWRGVHAATACPLLLGLPSEPRFYFVHSYHFLCDEPRDVVLTTEYGYTFTAAFARDNIYGVQFHPEKSHKYGMGLLKRFAAL